MIYSAITAPINPMVAQSDFLKSRPKMVIGGTKVDAFSGESLPVIDPSTGTTVAQIPSGDHNDANIAVEAASRCFHSPVWQKMKPVARQHLLLKLADLVESHADELAALESIDGGKPLAIARGSDLSSGIDVLRYFAGWATKLTGSTLDVSVPRMPDGEFFAYTKPEAIGVIAAITPWNFPFSMATWKIGPALAAGCTVVLKPSEHTSLTSLMLAELALEAGFPIGALNVVTGEGATIGAALVSHPQVDKVSFTGSVPTGQQIGRICANLMRPVTLELGGKSPMIVMPDADLDEATTGVQMAILFNQGQTCTSGSRLFVHDDIHEEFVAKIVERAKSLPMGGAYEDGVFFGPMISEEHAQKVMSYVDLGAEEGVEFALRGERVDRPGFFVSPTIMTETNRDMRVVREEIFGPVLAVSSFSDTDDVIKRANDSEFGLAASIWTQNISRAQLMTKRIKAGLVWINCHNMFDPNLPIGGMRMSGVGKDLGRASVEACLHNKSVMTRLA